MSFMRSLYVPLSIMNGYPPRLQGCCSAVKLMEREAITQLTGAADEDILYGEEGPDGHTNLINDA